MTRESEMRKHKSFKVNWKCRCRQKQAEEVGKKKLDRIKVEKRRRKVEKVEKGGG